MIQYLAVDSAFKSTMRLWMSAVCSLCFYGMCRINEVLQIKFGDFQLNLKRASRDSEVALIHYGCFTIRDRKTDHDPHASRTYYLHRIPKEE